MHVVIQGNHQKIKATKVVKKKMCIVQEKRNRIIYIKKEFNIRNWLNRFCEKSKCQQGTQLLKGRKQDYQNLETQNRYPAESQKKGRPWEPTTTTGRKAIAEVMMMIRKQMAMVKSLLPFSSFPVSFQCPLFVEPKGSQMVKEKYSLQSSRIQKVVQN